MIISKLARVEKAVDRQFTRYAMAQCHLDTDGKRLVATNGKYLVAYPVEIEEGDESGPIEVKAIVAARKAAPKNSQTFSIKANGHYIFQDGGTMPRNKDLGRFPDWKAIVPSENKPAKQRERLGIDASYLATIQEAIAADSVTLEFIEGTNAIRVKGNGGNEGTREAIALIMPCE